MWEFYNVVFRTRLFAVGDKDRSAHNSDAIITLRVHAQELEDAIERGWQCIESLVQEKDERRRITKQRYTLISAELMK